MRSECDVLVLGGGPAGLTCATLLAESGMRVILIERKPLIGPKVCAGGITWHGLLQHVPSDLIEGAFPRQLIYTKRQKVIVASESPIVGTVSRLKLGQWMASQAQEAGVDIWQQSQARTVLPDRVEVMQKGQLRSICYSHLVGADGANSLVRRYAGISTKWMGIGLNAMVDGQRAQMEWHVLPQRFGAGYGWIFPHRDQFSIGVYADRASCEPAMLKQECCAWAAELGINLNPERIRGGLVNYDYCGVHCSAQTWLVGDAAGLASGLTGEGIYPAIISARAVADMIRGKLEGNNVAALERMVKKHEQHRKLVRFASRHPRYAGVLMESLALLLRMKWIDFQAMEMAD